MTAGRFSSGPPQHRSPLRSCGTVAEQDRHDRISAMLSMSGVMSWIMRLNPKSGLTTDTVKVDDHQSPYCTKSKQPILVTEARHCTSIIAIAASGQKERAEVGNNQRPY
jgi:hypothetical protein